MYIANLKVYKTSWINKDEIPCFMFRSWIEKVYFAQFVG